MIGWVEYLELLGALVVAGVLGGVVGLEREIHRRWAGFRTHILVSMGAALFVLAITALPNATPADVSRVIQGITTGLGFIGAGTILKLTDRLEVKGLTTASTIWVAAALGVTAGLKLYPLAVTAAVLVLVVLTCCRWLEPDCKGMSDRSIPWSKAPPREP